MIATVRRVHNREPGIHTPACLTVGAKPGEALT